MSEAVDAGSVELDSIKITTFTGGNPQEIRHLVIGLDVFESLDNYTIVCDIIVSEGIELLNFLPAGGEEKISFKIKTPASGKEISYDFFVESITDMVSNDMGSLKTYALRCVTMDAMKNSYSLFTKRYKDMEYKDAIREVVEKDLGAGKPLATPDSTKGFFDYTVNRARPFQVIDLICERSVSSKYKGSDYIFYEDNEKYQFLTIEYLIETRKAKADAFQFEYPTGKKAEQVDKRLSHRNILKYEVFDQGDSMNKIKVGAHKNKYMEFDILHGDYFESQEYVNSGDHMSFQKTDSPYDTHSSAYNSFAETSPALVNLALKDGTRPEMQINKNMHFKTAFRQKIFAYGMNIRVYGDTNLMVGDLIKLNVPEITSLDVEPEDQEVYSGIFLVRAIRHMLEKQREGTGKFEHFMVLDCRRPNLKRSLG
jgi:hypothetical protein